METSLSSSYYSHLTYHAASPFAAAALKVKRANEHLSELANAARDLPRRRNYHLVVDNSKAGKVRLTYMPANPLPLEFAGVTGDAVHNLRSAFDYIAIALAAPPIGTGNPKHISFPTGDDQQKFLSELQIKMKGAKPEACRLVEELEPYEGGKYPLRALHNLDILDKHKLLIPAVSLLHLKALSIFLGEKQIVLRGTDFEPNFDRTNFTANIDIPSNFSGEEIKFGSDFDAAFMVVFGKGQPLQGEPIVPMLSQMTDIAERFIERCETLSFDSK